MKGKPDESEAITAKLVTRNPGYTEAQLWLARALLAQGKTEAAQNQLERLWNIIRTIPACFI